MDNEKKIVINIRGASVTFEKKKDERWKVTIDISTFNEGKMVKEEIVVWGSSFDEARQYAAQTINDIVSENLHFYWKWIEEGRDA